MAYDNICKYLTEEYPAEFVRWLSGDETSASDINPAPLLSNPALLPFGSLARSDSPTTLLETDLTIWLDEHQLEETSDRLDA